ncbi:hypothetical protein DL96DRAFT_1615461 [Flagelloscypha sp. PMI_526]|nr:hypothetical protein DL96DRAFT_1615461 [Flagelloscypha sp. PMI_526]
MSVSALPGELQGRLAIRQVPSRYSNSQVLEWLHHIGYPSPDLSTFVPNLENLAIVTRLTLLKIPFENTALHYTVEKVLVTSLEGLFEHLIVKKRGYGSICFLLNLFLLEMLRGLRYRAYLGAGRMNRSQGLAPGTPILSPLHHGFVFVQPSPPGGLQTWIVDIGRGHSNPVRPIPLKESPDSIIPGSSPPEEHRLIRAKHPDSSFESPPLRGEWELQIRCGKITQGEWRTILHFAEAEYFANDFDAWTYLVAHRPPGQSELHQSNAFFSVYAVKEVPSKKKDDEGGDGSENLERWVLFRDQFRVQKGEEVEVTTLHSEEERVELLREKFGIQLGEDAVEMIGEPTALPRLRDLSI